MHLSTGIARVLLTQPWKPRLASVEEGMEMRFRVWPSDLDINLHMNNSKFPVAMEVARWAFVARAGFGAAALRERWTFLVAAQNIIYFRPLGPFRRYAIQTRVLHADDAWLYFEQHVRQGGRLAATGLFRLRLKRGADPLSPRDVLRRAGHDPPALAEPELVAEWNRVSAGLLAAKKREEAGGPEG